MDSKTIRTALGLLQVDPEDARGWQSLTGAVNVEAGDLSPEDMLHLLGAAAQRHGERGEWEAVARLLQIAADAAEGRPEQPEILGELARVNAEELLDEPAARQVWGRMFDLSPDDSTVARLEESTDKEGKWQELVGAYAGEADDAADEVYKSSMLMRAAEVALRYGGAEADVGAAVARLEQAVRLDTNNERAARILERVYRRDGKWEDAARVLERLADRAEQPAVRAQAGRRLGRLYQSKLDDKERAIRAYTRVLKDAPDDSETKDFLSELFSREERWEDLAKLYEREIGSKEQSSERIGDMLQIAMLYWKKLGHPREAEPWFERVRKLEPANSLALAFYREHLASTGDDARLISILQAAQRAASDDEEKARLGTELARLTESQISAQKAIEQYKSVLRHDPDNAEAREALKRLYKQTEGYNALVELLRQQLERTSPNEYEARLAILRDVAQVYRTYIKSDTALVSVLNQIVQLDEKVDAEDVLELRELVELYERLGRWRDLLTYQLKLAEVSPDLEERKRLYRAAGQRWLEQFTNVQNATEAYEALLKLAPDDMDARQRLEELYRKRRAWPALYELFEKELGRVEGPARIATMKEMAQLAAERLNRGQDAVQLYKRILDEDPSRTEVLDSLEKHAERARDWATLAEALERRAELLQDEKDRLAVLQKLGTVYAEHLQNPQLAARAWRRVLELQPGHHRALRVLRDSYLEGGDYAGLEDLYASQNDFEGLAEVLSTAADRAKDPATKIEISYRAAAVYEDRLGQPDRAFRSYERVLATDPTDARAARALIPLYENDEKWARLPALYEVLLERSTDDAERVRTLERLVEITGSRLSDRKAAMQYARRAYAIDPLGTLDLLSSSARASGSWEAFVEAVEQRLSQGGLAQGAPAHADEAEAEVSEPKRRRRRGRKVEEAAAEPAEPAAGSPNPEERRTLELELARVYSEELGRSGDAVAVYRRLLERDPADVQAASALEAILRREDRRDDLRWLLDLRVTHAPDDEERVRILVDWAMLEEDVFESPPDATRLYRRVLEFAPENPTSLRALPRLLLAAGDARAAAAVIERDRDRLSGGERAEREVELAELYLDRLEDHSDALEAAIRALELTPQHPRAIDVLERLQQVEQVRARAARVLAEVYAANNDARREARSLGVLLDHTKDPGERLDLFERLASVNEQKLSSYSTALDVSLRAVVEHPGELRLWDRAEALAGLSGRPTDLADRFREVLARDLPATLQCELSERAARLHEEKLGDPMGATPYLEKVLGLDPGNERAFQRLKDILTGHERWGELEAMYDRASQVTTDRVRKTEMLIEVALICEEIMEDLPRATTYYERIIEIDPTHDSALRALDRLYAQQERNKDLASLLERRLEMAQGDDATELELRLARLQLEKLLEPERAVVHVEHVLENRPNDRDARQLAERILEIGSLRGRAARMLEAVYEARGEIRDLVRVLAIRLEELDRQIAESTVPDALEQRRELLRRIAVLRDQRLHEDDGAFDAFARLVPMDPNDDDARARLVEIGRRLGAHERVAQVLTAAADAAESISLKGEILMKVAAIYEEQLGDREQAEATYRRVLALDEQDPTLVLPAARSLERIYVAMGRNDRLAEMLRTQVALEQASETRSALLGRLGELCQGVLGDDRGAIQAWKARAEENPDDDVALAALDELYQRTERWRELVDVLERRRELAVGGVRRTLMTRAAKVLAERLASVQEAIAAWRAVVDEFGPDEESLVALELLFRSAQRWDELAETYERHLEVVSGDTQRLELFANLGDLRKSQLSDVSAALSAYRNALMIDTSHARSREALEALLDSPDLGARREAAEVLHPIYEADADNEKLLKVLEIEVDTAEDPLEKLAGLEKAIDVAEGPLADKRRAFGYAQSALRIAVGHAELGPWLERLERLAEATGRQADYVALLCEVVPEIFDGDVQLAVTLRIAELARHRLGDRELAREYYDKALELRADDASALAALESLYEEAGDAARLLGILERRVEIAQGDEERKQLLFRRAKLLAEVLEDRPRAIEVYEAILDIALDPAALQALERLYTREERWADLVSLYERQLEGQVGERADLHVKIAGVAARHQHDAGRAFDELERALEVERQNEPAIAELERLLTEGEQAEHRARAAMLLEPVYLLRTDYGRVMASIRARLEYSQDPEERRELLGRLAQLYEEQQEDYVQALETTALLLHEDIADQNTINELERLAKVAGAEKRLAEIYATELDRHASDDEHTARLARRTGELFVQLGELDRALLFLRRALAFEPESKELFQAIDDILERTGRHEERVVLYRDALDHRFEPRERLTTLHTVAMLQREKLGTPDDAIETYRAALDVDGNDAKSLDALSELYQQRRRWDDLAELYLRRAEAAEKAEAGAKYRLALARLLRTELSDNERAIEQLDEVVRTVPNHAEAIRELEGLLSQPGLKERVVEILRPLYEAHDDWRHTIKLNEERFGLAQDVSEKVSVLRETAELWEKRGGDQQRALRALRVAFELDPDDADVRAELQRLSAATGSWAELAALYDAVLAQNPELGSRRDVIAALAQICDERLDDPRRALDAYGRLHEVDPGELEPLEKGEQLAMLLSDWPVVVRMLVAKADLVLGDPDRASLWRRVGEAKRDMLDDAAGAVEAYERALDLEPESAFTVDCLIELYEAKDEAQRLVDLYLRRVELAGETDPDLVYGLLVRAARVYEEKLNDRLKAIEVLNQALGVKPADRAVLSALDRLYRAEQMWPELLENLKLEASSAETAAERARLRKEIGATLAEKLESHEDALDAYRLVLDELPGDAETIAAVRRIANEHDDLRGSVAAILVPVLGSVERWDELVSVLEMRLSMEGEPAQRAETLRNIAQVLESKLGRPADAHKAILRAVAERPEDTELHREGERLAELADGWRAYADALGERAQSSFDPEIGKDLYTRLGRISEEKLRDDARAIAAYGRALEQAGDDPALLEALDRLYTRAGDAQALAEILERRASVETSDERQADLHHRLAVLQVNQFGDPARALSSLRAALERVPTHAAAAEQLERLTGNRELFDEAAEVLEGVYRRQGATIKLAALFERRVLFAQTVAERLEKRRSLALVLEDDCNDPVAAQRVLEQGLVDDPADPDLLAEIERLAPLTGNWRSAGEALSTAVEQSRTLSAETARELCERVAGWYRDRVNDPAAAELALTKALGYEPSSDQVLLMLEELQRGPGRERDLVATLRRRAKLSSDDADREALYRRAKELADGLGDARLGEDVLRELLATDETNAWALAALTTLREAAGDYEDTYALLLKRIDSIAGGVEVAELRHKAAAIARDKLGRDDQAMELFQALFDDHPEDQAAAQALRQLYERAKRWDDLGRLIERLIDLTDDKAQRAGLRIELARMESERYTAHDKAIDLLRAVLEELPGHSEAVVALSELLEKTKRDEELAELLTDQIAAARERGDVDGELRLQVRLGEVCESRLDDKPRAIETYRAVLERSPQHRRALEALARLYQAAQNHSEAARVLDQLLEMSGGEDAVELSATLADTYAKLGDDAGVVGALERGLRADERHTALRMRLRSIYASKHNWEKLAAMIARDAELADATEQKVKLLREAADIHATRRGDQIAAAELLERASALKPDDRELLLQLCDAYSASGKGKAAAEVLEKVVESYGGKRSKDLAEIHRRLADAYLAEGEKEKALGELDKAFRIEPGNVHVLKKLGEVALEVGDLKKAQQMFRALLLQRLDEKSPITKAEVFYFLGEIHTREGDKVKAKQQYERAVQADSTLEKAKQRLEELK